jgi:glycosyl transferase family 25
MTEQLERIFLINLDRSVERLAHMQEQFGRLGVVVERVPGVEGLNIPSWMRSEFKGPHLLSAGEVGCYASHLVVAQKIVAEGLPYAVVLEDDAVLDDDFQASCADAIEHAPEDWDLIHLSAAPTLKRAMVAIADLSNTHRTLVRYLKFPWTATAYIVSNRGARKCLAPLPRVCPIDWANSHPWIQGLNELGVHPAPAQQNMQLESQIGFSRAHELRDLSPGLLSILYGVWWTMRQVGPGYYLRARAMNWRNSLMRRLGLKRRVSILAARGAAAQNRVANAGQVQRA